MHACEYFNVWLKNLIWMLLKTPQKLWGPKKETGMGKKKKKIFLMGACFVCIIYTLFYFFHSSMLVLISIPCGCSRVILIPHPIPQLCAQFSRVASHLITLGPPTYHNILSFSYFKFSIINTTITLLLSSSSSQSPYVKKLEPQNKL